LTKSDHKRRFPTGWFSGPRTAIFLLATMGVFLVLSSGCGQKANKITLASLSQMPDYVKSAPPNVQEAYRFAVANPKVLEQIPCYCGCAGMGHRHNLDCYVDAFRSDGRVARFDNHAAY
jgi:hypothetical protein